MNIVCVDDDGCIQSVALAFLVTEALTHHKFGVSREDVHKDFWPCSGKCATCASNKLKKRDIAITASKMLEEM